MSENSSDVQGYRETKAARAAEPAETVSDKPKRAGRPRKAKETTWA
ncbi:hypothetical protein MKK67_01105 [Methylobacterium sp. J-072]|nr:hypothetical protein [Methylobacterium sp. J-072]MCJ2091112.1 hypothetical protein [Methylobacterium sp. J-072]